MNDVIIRMVNFGENKLLTKLISVDYYQRYRAIGLPNIKRIENHFVFG